MELTKGVVSFFLLSAVFSLSLEAQTASQSRLLSTDLERFERESANTAGRKDAFKSLALLYQLSGNTEKALEAWFSAAYAGSIPDYDALLEAARLLISMGEYERADEELRKIPAGSNETVFKARLLWAELTAFSRGETWLLTQMASDIVYLSQRSEIYYVLWKTTGDDSWKTRLLAEFPQSPEARISGGGNVSAAATPQWLLFSIPAPASSPPAAAAPAVPPPQVQPQQSGTVFFQTGLYRVESNAMAEAERLERAGFRASLSMRQSNGASLWAVLVDGGRDSSATLRQLKNAGWPDAFPASN